MNATDTKINFVNLSDRVINILNSDGTIIKSIEPEECPNIRLRFNATPGDIIDGVQLYNIDTESIELPEERDDTIYVVSIMQYRKISQAYPNRTDIYTPYNAVRDNIRLLGYKALARIV